MGNPPPCADLLSDLPVCLIESIMLFLPIKDAIRTSILSTKWRFKWTTLPHLVFDANDCHLRKVNQVAFEKSSSRFKTFVTRTLLRHEGPLHKFKISAMINRCAETDKWLLFLRRKYIKELILDMNKRFNVPYSLNLFQNLTFLELDNCVFSPPPPNFKGFPCLRTLFLRRLCVPLSTIQSIVAQSPLLESLECSGGLYSDSKLIISVPSLKYLNLTFYSNSGENVYFYAPLLTKLSLSVNYEQYTLHQKAACCYYTKFLGGFANLDTLIGDGGLTKYLIRGIEHYQRPLVFHRLKTITFGEVSFKSMDEILVFVRLIVDASATLCDLQFSSNELYEYREDVAKNSGAHLWDSICPQNCTFGKLKFVKVENFHGVIQEMNLIQFLLVSSPVLEVLKVERFCNDNKRGMNTMVELLSYPRASSSAYIIYD